MLYVSVCLMIHLTRTNDVICIGMSNNTSDNLSLSEVLLHIRIHIASFVLVRCIIRHTDTYNIICPCQMYYYTRGYKMMLYISVCVIIHLTRTNDVIYIRMSNDTSDKNK
jgi:hypothetical protein